MGPVQPPQRKGHLPLYSRNQLSELQEKCDDLERLQVLRRPEDVGVQVEYLNPSFLVCKPNGGSRLVTAFTDVGRYSKPQPSILPNVDDTLRTIAQWKHIVVTDLTKAFYQTPLAKESMKYCGIATPFRGVRVYARSAMGIPGSEVALEELLSRVLGHLIQEGIVAKIADDLYVGGNSGEELLNNWVKVLEALDRCDLTLSRSKTIINPRSTTILGWVWTQGTLQASPHSIATLSSCDCPQKVEAMKSFIGAFKILSRVIPHCANFTTPLENAITGLKGSDPVPWTDPLHDNFSSAQKALRDSRSITLPRFSDQLWIITDGAVRNPGIGATLYVTRNGQPKVAGFFSAKLRKHQVTWLPCELEALSIASSIKHFSPYLVQSDKTGFILTDSKPCVEAFEKLHRGEFSASPRVTTFLSTASRFQVSLRHLLGCANLVADFASRNAPSCTHPNCQICSFINHTENSVVRNVTVNDVLLGSVRVPFSNRNAWINMQNDCRDLRRVRAHLKQGTRPSKKQTNIKNVKRYLQTVMIARDGLLVVHSIEPLSPTREKIVIPRSMLEGLLTALHNELCHPSLHQLRTVVHCYFWALDMEKSLESVSKSCPQCAALVKTPKFKEEQSTQDPPESVGSSFNADVIKRERQHILVLRENITSYTGAMLVENEQAQTLRDGLICLALQLCPMVGSLSVIRVDPAPGFQALDDDPILHKYSLRIEIGRPKSSNKVPVADRAIQELEGELLKLQPTGGPVTPVQLSIALHNLNARLRGRGFSSREMWSQHDQFTNTQLPFEDNRLVADQQMNRFKNHPLSAESKAPGRSKAVQPDLQIGDLVYLYMDGNKYHARDRYIVSSIEGEWCNIRKFVGRQLRSSSYRVKQSDCFKIPVTQSPESAPNNPESDTDSDASIQGDEPVLSTSGSHKQPPIPPIPRSKQGPHSPSPTLPPLGLSPTACARPDPPLPGLPIPTLLVDSPMLEPDKVTVPATGDTLDPWWPMVHLVPVDPLVIANVLVTLRIMTLLYNCSTVCCVLIIGWYTMLYSTTWGPVKSPFSH